MLNTTDLRRIPSDLPRVVLMPCGTVPIPFSVVIVLLPLNIAPDLFSQNLYAWMTFCIIANVTDK